MIDFLIILLMLIAFVAYLVKGTTGFGEGLIVISLFGIFLDMKLILPIALLLAIIGGLYQFFIIKKDIDKKIILLFALPLTLGVIFGTYLLTQINSNIIKIVFAIFLILYSLKSLFMKSSSSKKGINRFVAIIVGLFAGILDGLIGLGGIPLIIYLDFHNYKKDSFRATLVFLFIILGLVRVVTYGYSGLFTSTSLIYTAYLIPVTILGTHLGMKIYPHINQQLFRKIVMIFLLIVGVILLVK